MFWLDTFHNEEWESTPNWILSLFLILLGSCMQIKDCKDIIDIAIGEHLVNQRALTMFLFTFMIMFSTLSVLSSLYNVTNLFYNFTSDVEEVNFWFASASSSELDSASVSASWFYTIWVLKKLKIFKTIMS